MLAPIPMGPAWDYGDFLFRRGRARYLIFALIDILPN